MAKNIYRKYRAVETFKYIEEIKNQDYYDELRTTLNNKLYYYLTRSNLNTGSIDNFATSYSIDQNTGQFIMSDLITERQAEDRMSRFYINLNSLDLYKGGTISTSYTHIDYGKTGYESGTHIIEFQYVYMYGYTGVVTAEFVKGLKTKKVSTGFVKGEYLGEVEAEAGTYPLEQNYNGYWYEFDRASNKAPIISGYNMDYGAKDSDFDIEYIVNDADNDSVSVEIKVNNTVIQDFKTTALGVKQIKEIDLDSLNFGRHTITITARDTKGALAYRTYTFQKVNSAPTVSGYDVSLGERNNAFTYTYQVNDTETDTLKVYEKLNGVIFKTRNNPPKNSDLVLSISEDQMAGLTIGQRNTIEIEVIDSYGSSTYRRVTFVKSNKPPIISGSDTDLGKINSLNYNYQVSDGEGDKIYVTVELDGRVITNRFLATDSRQYNVNISGFEWNKLNLNKHTLKITAEDAKGATSYRTVTFTRNVNRLVMELNNPIQTDILAKKIMVSTAGVNLAKGATLKVEVCNNSFDDKPTWEDATSMTQAGKAFNFQNLTKQASKAGINIRFTIDKGSSTSYSYITAIGGSYE